MNLNAAASDWTYTALRYIIAIDSGGGDEISDEWLKLQRTRGVSRRDEVCGMQHIFNSIVTVLNDSTVIPIIFDFMDF